MRIKNRYLRTFLLRTFIGPRLRKSEAQKFRQEFDHFRYLADQSQPRFDFRWEDRYPVLGGDGSNHGFDRHYVYHTAWAARKLVEIAPDCHIDISSSLYFSSIVSAFIPIYFYDYRPAQLELNNLTCGQADLMKLPFDSDSIQSLSCMHVVEHIGLGRYGDPLNPDGDLMAMQELIRVLAPGGSLLFVVPVGFPSLHFNSHRIYSYAHIIDALSTLELVEFSLIPDDRRKSIIIHADPNLVAEQSYGCGCFWLKKK